MRVTVFVLTAALTVLSATLSAAERPTFSPIHWTYATEARLVLVSVDRDPVTGKFGVMVADPNVFQEFEYTVPRYEDGRLYRHHVWEIWIQPPKTPRNHLGIRDFDSPSRYHRIIFFVSTERGDIPQWLEVRDSTDGVIVEVTTVLP